MGFGLQTLLKVLASALLANGPSWIRQTAPFELRDRGRRTSVPVAVGTVGTSLIANGPDLHHKVAAGALKAACGVTIAGEVAGVVDGAVQRAVVQALVRCLPEHQALRCWCAEETAAGYRRASRIFAFSVELLTGRMSPCGPDTELVPRRRLNREVQAGRKSVWRLWSSHTRTRKRTILGDNNRIDTTLVLFDVLRRSAAARESEITGRCRKDRDH